MEIIIKFDESINKHKLTSEGKMEVKKCYTEFTKKFREYIPVEMSQNEIDKYRVEQGYKKTVFQHMPKRPFAYFCNLCAPISAVLINIDFIRNYQLLQIILVCIAIITTVFSLREE